MALPLKDKKISTLILIVLVGIIIGAYLNALVLALPGESVVKTFFTTAITFGVGDFAESQKVAVGVGDTSESLKPLIIDLYAMKFQFGFQFKFTMFSILGVFLSLYFFRWYK
jgi:hypothetical protein